ncbi:uncharacterized protein B0H64DRAFT_461504 [Chaetomium fimeti]|uniref:Uncharacterized protein n=1 Tax=Chaetomium fimeti TaxID=1854472 RepID=A0AAE0HH13_9PEZI|nr:hypothetical protein B0H64DRAFT_461504 [Chaetomium fimeti]
MAKLPPEHIAITGTACRFPGGATSPSKLWQLLTNPRNVRTRIPTTRFDPDGFYNEDGRRHGCTNADKAYLLEEDIRLFDNAFFGVRAAEAESMDPQQRLLLEVVFEGLESAGYSIQQLRGSSTAVYVGQLNGDYYDVLLRDVESAPPYTATGTSRSIMSNRVSYFFDWKGPSMTLDTACSSSLVAVHLAVQSLGRSESTVAIAAGVNLLLGPEQFIFESNLGMLSPQGRCAMWDASADGYARGEGIAVVVLKPLSQALRDGDFIHCIIRETGVNQDGRSTGITMPSATAQADLIRSTYLRCGLDPLSPEGRCQYFEAHGTGTPAGDPVEAQAVQSVFFPVEKQEDMADASQPNSLPVGSVKTIIGHTEGTAGLAGLIKASLAIQHGVIPPNMHFQHMNPAVRPFCEHLYIPLSPQTWPRLPEHVPRRVSVNSFGFGGTNCHVIVEGWQTEDERESVGLQPCGPLTISAHSATSLVSAVSSLAQLLQTGNGVNDANLADLIWTLQTRRTEFQFKASFAASATKKKLSQQLHDWLAVNRGDNNSSLQLARSRPIPAEAQYPPILGIFTGQGAQWPRMAATLLDKSRCFRQTIQSLEQALATLPDAPSWSLQEQLRAPPETSRIHEAAVSQPLCTAVQIGLVDLLSAAGIRLTKVVGHSSGEIAAAYAAGYLTAPDAIRIAYYRGISVRRASGKGRMLAAGITLRDAELLCAEPRFVRRLAVAASNSPTSVTLSGDADAMEEALDVLVQRDDVFARALKVDTAYHSHHMRECVSQYRESLERCGIRVLNPGGAQGDISCVWYSSVHPGFPVDPASLSCSYWIDNMANPVLFSQAVEAALRDSEPWLSSQTVVALEVGPHPALKQPVTDVVKAAGLELEYSSVLRRGADDMEAVCAALGFVWTQFLGGSRQIVDFDGFRTACVGNEDKHMDLPTYSWDHERPLWNESRASTHFRTRNTPPHPLLGNLLLNTDPSELRWRNIMKLSEMGWLKGHKFQGQVLFPAQGYVSMAVEGCLALSRKHNSVRMLELEDLVIHRGLTLQDDDESAGTDVFSTLTVVMRSTQQIVIEFTICSAPVDSKPDVPVDPAHLNFNCRATLALESLEREEPVSGPAAHLLPPRVSHDSTTLSPVDVAQFYSSIASTGLEYSGDFLAAYIERANGFATVQFNRPKVNGLHLHPALLDVASHGILAALAAHQEGMLLTTYLPTSIVRVRVDVARLLRFTGAEGNAHTQGTAGGHQQFELSADCHVCVRSPTEIRCDVDVFGGPDEYPEIQIEGLTCSPFGSFTEQDERAIFSHSVWKRDISSGIDLTATDREFDLTKHVEETDLVTRAVYFYLRKLRDEFDPETMPTAGTSGSASTRGASNPSLTAYWDWAVEHALPRIEAGQHPRVHKEWASDCREFLIQWAQRLPDLIDLKVVMALGEALPDLFRGQVPALQLLMQDNMLTDYYQRGLGLKQSNKRGGAAAAQIVHRYPDMRILEVGGGTGSATLAILSRIEDKFTSYTFTDISSGFFDDTRQTLGSYAARVVFQTLDISRDPSGEQGFEAGTYDLVVASNVLHATPTLEDTLRNCRRLLRPGGYLLLVENTASTLSTEFIFGTLPGWWLGADEGRADSPLVSEARWHSYLLHSGFSGVDAVTRDVDEDSRYYTYSIMVSQAVDDRVTLLREPLSTHNTPKMGIPKLGAVKVIGSTELAGLKMAYGVASLLSPFAERVTVVDKLELVRGYFPPDTAVICLAELVEPALRDVTPERLSAIQNILCKSTHVLWLTRGRISGDEPHAGMVLGIARSAMLELPGRPMQFVDCNELDMNQSTARWIASTFLRMVRLGRSEFDDVLWRRETEVLVDGRGNELLPRIIPHKELNNRLNSRSRAIVDNVDVSQRTPLHLVSVGEGSFELRQVPELRPPSHSRDCRRKTHVRVCVRYSSLCGFRLRRAAAVVYLCLGTEQDSGRQVIALTPVNASYIEVPVADTWGVGTDGKPDPETLKYLLRWIVAQSLVYKSHGRNIWVHEPDTALARVLTEAAEHSANGARMFYSSSEYPSKLPGDYTFIHPQSTARMLGLLAPRQVSVYANMHGGGSECMVLDGLIRASIGDKARVSMMPRLVNSSDKGLPQWEVELAYSETGIHRVISTHYNQATGRTGTVAEETRSRVLPVQSLASVTGKTLPDVADVVDWSCVGQTSIPAIVRPLDARFLLSPDRTYFLAGLTGSMGLSLCGWMADHGARYFALASRNPSVDLEVTARLAQRGVTLRVHSVDLADRESLTAARRSLTAPEHGSAMPPVGGVVNGAMILRDRAFENMSIDDFEAALRPKVQGSLNLEAVFGAHDNLDFFIFLSSASSVLGVPGLTNYGAANLFMCGLAQQRRRRGAPASVIDIGALADIGYLTRSSNPHEAGELARKHNTKPLSESDLHTMFAEAVFAGSRNLEQEADIMTGIGFWDLSSPDQARRPGWFNQPRMSHYLVRSSIDPGSGGSKLGGIGVDNKPSIRRQLSDAGADGHAALRVLESGLLQKLEKALQIPSGTLDAQVPLLSLGVDSLVAIQLRSWMAEELGVNMAALGILASASVKNLSAELFRQLPDTEPEGATSSETEGANCVTSTSTPTPSAVVTDPDYSESSASLHIPTPPEPVAAAVAGDDEVSFDPEAADIGVAPLKETSGHTNDEPRNHALAEPEATPTYIREGNLSPGQGRLLFLDRYLADKSTYNCALAGRVYGTLDINRLKDALGKIVQMHESLRTCFFFDQSSGKGRQRVKKNGGCVLEHRIGRPGRLPRFQAELDRMRKHEFNLADGDMVKVTVLPQTRNRHIIIVAYHHLVMDGLSLVVFLRQLEAAYSGAQDLAPPSLQAIDLAEASLEGYADPATLQKHIAFWQELHRDGPAPLPLFPFAKTKHRKQPLDAYGSYSFQVKLGADFAQQVRAKCAQLRATPFHLYLTALAAFLSRWLDISDLCIGIVDSNRPHGNTDTIGCFLNMLALRFRLDGYSGFDQLVSQTRDMVFSAMAHSATPFDTVIDHLRVPREAHHPLFQAAINYRMGHGPTRSMWDDGCEVEWTDMVVARNPFDLQVDITEIGHADGVWISLGVQSYLYSDVDAGMLAKSFTSLVKGAIDDCGSGISAPPTIRSLNLVDDADRLTAIRLGCAPTLHSGELPRSLVHCVDQVASQHADDVAIKHGSGVPLTYGAMIQIVNQMSHSLQHSGVRAGDFVAVYLAASAEALCAMLAIMRLGAIYVPLDRRNPIERLGLIVADCQPRVLVYKGHEDFAAVGQLGDQARGSALLDLGRLTQPPGSGQQPTEGVDILATADGSACAIYTSGSTGRPKGVLLTHFSLLNQLCAVRNMLNIGREVVLQQSSLGFDCSLEQIFGGLANGGTVVIAPEEARGDPAALAAIMVAEGVTCTVGVPSEYAALLTFAGETLKRCSTWRIAVSGGEKLTANHAAGFASLDLPRLRLVNAYGPTEGTVSCTRGAIDYRAVASSMEDPHMGLVMTNYSIVIVGEDMEPVPGGWPGEIYIGGQGVARGYVNRSVEEHERFVTPGFAKRLRLRDQRFYRTGDLGRISHDGTLHFLGRIEGDSQVQIHGVRVELDEVAAAILRTAGSDTISDAALSLRDGSLLVAFVILSPGLRTAERASIARSLAQVVDRLPLPMYMRPALMVPVAELPITVNGKRDRRRIDALPIPDGWTFGGSAEEEGHHPLTDVELRVREAWKQVLPPAVRPGTLGPKSDFFRVGGSSLLLVHLQAVLQTSFGADIPLPELFRSSSLSGMAALLEHTPTMPPFGILDMDWPSEVESLASGLVAPSTHLKRNNPNGPQPDGLTVLLTGATGFLGTQLLSHLIAESRVGTIHCVAIRRDPSGRPRHVALSSPKIVEHSGDLGDPYLGLSQETFSQLATECDTIIHNGADVSFLKTYASLRAPNVLSTRTLAEMALTTPTPTPIPLHFISTASVAHFSPPNTATTSTPLPPISLQPTPPPPHAAQTDGYTASKWVSEALLERLAALHNTLHVHIHRPVSLALHGAPATDIVGALLQMGGEMGAVPRMGHGDGDGEGRVKGVLDLAGVEEVAGEIVRGVVGESEGGGGGGRVVFQHYGDGEKVEPGEFAGFLSGRVGRTVEEWEMERWLEEARKRGLNPLVGTYLEDWWRGGRKLVLPAISKT